MLFIFLSLGYNRYFALIYLFFVTNIKDINEK